MAGLALMALPAWTAQAQVSLATVVDLAQRNSDPVRLAQADLSKTQAILSQTKDVYMPSLVFGSGLPAAPSVGFSSSPPSIFHATLESLVFSMPQGQYLRAAQSAVQASELNLKSAREQADLDASTAYIELDTVNREIAATQDQESSANRLIEIERERAEAGVDPLRDLLDARLTAAQLKLKRLHLETRARVSAKQLANLTGLPDGSILIDHASIPSVPMVGSDTARAPDGILAARQLARSKQFSARGDQMHMLRPEISFSAQYNRDTTLLNNYSYYIQHFKTDNVSSGFQIEVPLFDIGRKAKSRESAAEALRATVEAEQAQRQNDLQIAELTSTLRELDAQAEVAEIKQEIAQEQVKTVAAELEYGNGSTGGSSKDSGSAGSMPPPSPKLAQLAQIDERQKFVEALDSTLELTKARLNLLRALGHMEDWLRTLPQQDRPAGKP